VSRSGEEKAFKIELEKFRKYRIGRSFRLQSKKASGAAIAWEEGGGEGKSWERHIVSMSMNF
jgi:hypothetical protein